MTRTAVSTCSHPGCRRPTASPTGRCPYHPGTTVRAAAASPLPKPSLPDPTYTKEKQPDGKALEEWRLNGERHRVGGPARVYTSATGEPVADYYFVHGHLTRLDGPAEVHHPDDEIGLGHELYWFHDEIHDSLDEVCVALLERHDTDPRVVEAEIRSSIYGPILDEGHEPLAIAQALAGGVHTVEGIREALGGAPIEWVRAWEENPDAAR